MTTILVARHGQTDWNLEGRFQGHADPPLNDEGRRQSAELAESLAHETFDAIYSSDLRRARETAETVASRLGLAVRESRRLREIDVGEFSGLTWAEIVERWPDAPGRVATRGYGWEHGESLEEMADRIVAAVEAIAEEHPDGRVLVVGHGATIRALLATADGLDIATHRTAVGPAANCAVYRLAAGNGSLRRVD